MIDDKIDFVGLSEVNEDWRAVKYEDSIWGATMGWQEHKRI